MLIELTWHSPDRICRLAEVRVRAFEVLLGLVLALLSAVATGAEEIPAIGASQPGFSDKVSVAYILVPVVARSQQGYVKGLSAQDFILDVDGQTVAFESFDVGDAAPVSVIFLQDLSGSMANAAKLSLSRLAIEQILRGARPGDRFSLASFADNELRVEVPFTDDPDRIDKATALWQPYGVTGLHDAVSGLPELTRVRQSDKRAAVLITDGVDNASRLSPTESRNVVRQAELPVYVLGLATGSPQDLDREGQKLHRLADVLNLLAHLTGGQYFWIDDPNNVVEAATTIVSDLRHQYVLGFSTADEGSIKYRQITVSTRKKKIRLTYRKGYEGLGPRLIAPSP